MCVGIVCIPIRHLKKTQNVFLGFGHTYIGVYHEKEVAHNMLHNGKSSIGTWHHRHPPLHLHVLVGYGSPMVA